MLAPCLHEVSKYDLKQVTEGAYRNLNSPNERTINVDFMLVHCIATLYTLSFGHVEFPARTTNKTCLKHC